jgi:response regulator of citrate/malate metabolism
MSIKKVLIAEDDMALKPLWENFFTKFSHPVDLHWTVSCEEALKILERGLNNDEDFDLIISDIFLAGSGTGMELLNSEEARRSRAKRLLISSVQREHILEEYSSSLTGVEVVSKPFNGSLYESVITNLLNL